jgi:hypothetical protein
MRQPLRQGWKLVRPCALDVPSILDAGVFLIPYTQVYAVLLQCGAKSREYPVNVPVVDNFIHEAVAEAGINLSSAPERPNRLKWNTRKGSVIIDMGQTGYPLERDPEPRS